MDDRTQESSTKEKILLNLSLPSSYILEKGRLIVKENIFNKKIYCDLDKQSSIFIMGVSRSAIYAISTVYYIESMNTLDQINYENILLFMKDKKYFETKNEENSFQKNKSTIIKYIDDYNKSLKSKCFIPSNRYGIFGSATNYESISKEYFKNLEEILKKHKKNPLEVHPGYKFYHVNDMFLLSPHSIKYLLRTFSKGDKEQVAVDLIRMSVFINKKRYDYRKYNSNFNLIYNQFLNDLKNEEISNQNALNFIESYAHQGALVGGWTVNLILAVAQEMRGMITNADTEENDDLGSSSIHFDSIHNDTIKITSIFPFKLRNMTTGDKMNLSKSIALTFQNIFIFPKNRITNSVIVSNSKMGLLNASLSNVYDASILKIFKKAIEKNHYNYSLENERVTNKTEFKIL